MDEPETHLHPKWQNLFAEIMLLLVKELGCHVLLTTHSPNFMLALEANMRKYDYTNNVFSVISPFASNNFIIENILEPVARLDAFKLTPSCT